MKKCFVISLLFMLLTISLSAEWSNDPSINNAICSLTGEQAIPKVVTSSTGDTYIGWFSNDSGNYNLRLQRLDQFGNEYWATDGIVISDNPAMTWLTDWDMTVDGNNYAILTFQDIRNGGNNNIYVYKVAPDGSFFWGEDGIELSNSAAFDVAPKVCVTSESGTVITWQSDDAIIMQRIANNGTLVWGPTGITLSCADTYSWPQPFAVENDHILLKFFHDSGPAWAPTRHCYIQKFDNDGNAAWATDTIVSNADGITAWTQVFNIISDGDNGCFISWHDSRGGGTISYPFVQHVNSDGTVAYIDNGVQLSTETNRQNFYPESVYDSVNDELTTYWSQTDGSQNNHGITGQKLDTNGNLLWGANGNNIIAISALYVIPFAVRKTNDDTIVFYEEGVTGTDSYTKVMRLDTDGNFVWTGDSVTMCSVPSSKIHSVASQFNNNQIIASWEDERAGAKDIYAQNINLDGTLGAPTANGTIEGSVVISGGAGFVEDVEITAGTATVNPSANGDYEISIAPGTYEVTAVLEYYTPQTLIDIVVTEGIATTGIDFTLAWIPVYNPPQNLIVDPLTGIVTWDPPELYPGTEVQGYNFYLDGTFVEYCELLTLQLENLINGVEYIIGISAVYDGGWESEIVEIMFFYTGTNAGNSIVAVTKLINNYPNPFNPVTNIFYSVKERGNVSLEVYNLKGQLVKTLVNETKETGDYTTIWDGTDHSNKSVSSGIYLYRMKSDNYISTRKMILLK